MHAAAGGLGSFLCAWAKKLGARVVGTVSSHDKARLARERGIDVAIVAPDGSFADDVLAATGGRGVDTIFDGLGGGAHAENLRAIAPLGHWVQHGNSGAPHAAVPAGDLSAKSLTLSIPVLFHYTAQRERYEAMAAATFAAWRDGTLKPDIARHPLSGAADVHRALDARRPSGQLVLVP